MIITVGLTACTGVEITRTTTPGNRAHVVDVLDGDSLIVELGGVQEKVRLIGVNAPEHDECFGEESAAGLRELVGEADITIVTDVEARDQYGRLLGYVYLDGTFVNEEVVSLGLSLARAYEPNTSLQERINAAGRRAQQNQRGMWAPANCASASGSDLAIAGIEPNPPGPDEDDLNGEWVTIANTGSTAIDLTGWIVRDASSVHRYTFPPGSVLAAGSDLVLHTGCGDDGTRSRYWCADGPVWSNSGDSALLLDGEGRIAAIYDY